MVEDLKRGVGEKLGHVRECADTVLHEQYSELRKLKSRQGLYMNSLTSSLEREAHQGPSDMPVSVNRVQQ